MIEYLDNHLDKTLKKEITCYKRFCFLVARILSDLGNAKYDQKIFDYFLEKKTSANDANFIKLKETLQKLPLNDDKTFDLDSFSDKDYEFLRDFIFTWLGFIDIEFRATFEDLKDCFLPSQIDLLNKLNIAFLNFWFDNVEKLLKNKNGNKIYFDVTKKDFESPFHLVKKLYLKIIQKTTSR